MFLFVALKIFVLNPISIHAALRDRSNFIHSNLTIEFTINFIQKCLLQDDRTVAVIGDVPEAVVKNLHFSEMVVTASIGNSRSRNDGLYGEIYHSKFLYGQLFWIRMQRVVQSFVVAAPSQPLLRLALEEARTSVWWNSAAFFVVIGAIENDDCRNAFTYLWTLWEMGILYSVFLCREIDGSLAVYGYSPYYDGHSRSWRKVQVHGGRDGHPWALLKLKQVQDGNICETLGFDKVKTLEGYPIRSGVLSIHPSLVIYPEREGWLDKHVGEDATIIDIIWKTLNGSIRPTYYKGPNPYGFAEGNESYTGFMADVSLGRVDHGMNGLWADFYWRVRPAYPHGASGVHFLTSSKGNLPDWLKFARIYKIPVSVSIIATFLISAIFIRYIDQRPWSIAILEILRVLLSTAMLHLPIRLSSRIFWSMTFIMMLVITSCFQGLLISLLTKQMPYPNIDDVDDVLASGYPVYGYTAFQIFFTESKLSKQFHVDKKSSCFALVAEGRPIACVTDYMYLKYRTMANSRLHMSKESLAPYYTGYLTKIDWPLFDRFDNLVQRLFNAGITKYWREYFLDKMVREHWGEMRNSLPPNLKVLSVADLAFVFHLLIAGLLCSIAAFLIEFIFGRVRR